MKLTGDLKKTVEKAQTKEEAKDAIKKAGMILTDDELDTVAGGKTFPCGNRQLDFNGTEENGGHK